jgi:hypothetical protein
MLNGVYSAVVAGAEQVEPTPGEWTRGGIYVVSPADGSVPRSLIYWTPIKAGRLEIIAVDGTRVTLRSSNGTLFVFDAIVLQWMPPDPTPRPTRTYSPEALTAIAVKEANLQGERDYEATVAALSPAPMHTGAPTYPPPPTVELPIGIDTFEGCGGGEGNHDPLQMRNCWRGFLDGVYSGVVAGYSQATPEPGQEAQGGLYITSHLDDMNLFSRSSIYWTPMRAGAAQIITVDGTRFTLQTYNGTRFVFDASTRQWVDATPGPTPVPSLPPSPVPSSLPPTP